MISTRTVEHLRKKLDENYSFLNQFAYPSELIWLEVWVAGVVGVSGDVNSEVRLVEASVRAKKLSNFLVNSFDVKT